MITSVDSSAKSNYSGFTVGVVRVTAGLDLSCGGSAAEKKTEMDSLTDAGFVGRKQLMCDHGAYC